MREGFVEQHELRWAAANDIDIYQPPFSPGKVFYPGCIGRPEFREYVFQFTELQVEIGEDPFQCQRSGYEIELRQVPHQVRPSIGPENGCIIKSYGSAAASQIAIDGPHQAGLSLSVPSQQAGDLPCPALNINVGQDLTEAEFQLNAVCCRSQG